MPTIVPLGDQALLAYFPDESAALRFAGGVRQLSAAWLVDVVPAYTSVGVFFHPDQIRHLEVARQLRGLVDQAGAAPLQGRLQRIPCCYELGPDLARVAEHTGLTKDEVIRLHTATEYVVYAIGFSPGFP
jgi:inhibitor of KinA